jgi:hypothetical protein
MEAVMTGWVRQIVLAAVIGAGAVALLRAQVVRPGDTMQIWEYRSEVVRSAASPATSEQRAETRRLTTGTPDSMLNSYGRNGWELVGMTRREVRVEDTLETETLYVFKRPAESRNR